MDEVVRKYIKAKKALENHKCDHSWCRTIDVCKVASKLSSRVDVAYEELVEAFDNERGVK